MPAVREDQGGGASGGQVCSWVQRWAKKLSLCCENFLPGPAWLLLSKQVNLLAHLCISPTLYQSTVIPDVPDGTFNPALTQPLADNQVHENLINFFWSRLRDYWGTGMPAGQVLPAGQVASETGLPVVHDCKWVRETGLPAGHGCQWDRVASETGLSAGQGFRWVRVASGTGLPVEQDCMRDMFAMGQGCQRDRAASGSGLPVGQGCQWDRVASGTGLPLGQGCQWDRNN